jgi:hypothetical protein
VALRIILRQLTFAIPNILNTHILRLRDKAAARAACGLSQDALLPIGRSLENAHQRMDYLIAESRAWRKLTRVKTRLLIARAYENETEAVVPAAAELGENVVWFSRTNHGASKVLQLMQAPIFSSWHRGTRCCR